MHTSARLMRVTILAVAAALSVCGHAQPERTPAMDEDAPLVQVWVAGPLTNVLRDAPPPTDPIRTISLQAARDEYESAQVVMLPEAGCTGLTARASELTGPDKASIPASAIRCRFVGYVHLQANSPSTPSRELVAAAPGLFPDPLLEDEAINVEPEHAQPIWITLHVPADAPAGEYTGHVEISWQDGSVSVPLKLRVWPFNVPTDRHLLFTNWFASDTLAQRYGVPLYSEEFWPIFDKYVANCAAHRQNIIWVPKESIEITHKADDTWELDFTRFDRFIEILEKHGVADRIELTPLGGHKSGWSGKEIALHSRSVLDEKQGKRVTLSAREYLPHFLPALQEHLREKGWLHKTLLHIADEPSVNNVDSWCEKSDWVHSLAPEIARIDAIEGPNFRDSLEVWVPKLNHYVNWRDSYERARARGTELWFYTCCHPMGRFPNRYIDYPLIKTRILHWLNWRYKLTGYLHWGLIAWNEDPFRSAARGQLPPGDAWIIYPGEDGPIDSIRWEALRDGIEDYEYLWLLTEAARKAKAELGDAARDFDPEQLAAALCKAAVPDIFDYPRDPQTLKDLREHIAGEIVNLQSVPKLLVWTDPPAGELLYGPPASGVLYVAADPSTEVTINGEETQLDEKGFLCRNVFMGAGTREFLVTATKDGETTELRRSLTCVN